jgi:hypothetical protein
VANRRRALLAALVALAVGRVAGSAERFNLRTAAA